MKLVDWRRKQRRTQAEVADLLGCSQSYVSQMERTLDPIVPGAAVMIGIYEMTEGLVQPNDFFALPDLGRRKAA